ncbi:MAG TPA: hypothetical protein VKG63_15030 [Steroidobacteraceae bacterium]|nr:hypothetical protein [Steroidobacteraceae bacterium]
MRKNAGLMGATTALALLACTSSLADDMYPNSFVNVHANASYLRVSNNYYDNYGFYGYYGNYNSSTADGNGGGAAIRIVAKGGFMFDAVYNTDKVDVGDGNIRINQGTAGFGYMGNLGRGATWYAEGIYTTFQPKVTSNYLCNGSCGTITYNGGGVKGGFVWPFGARWYATADVGLAVLGGPNGTNSIVQGIFGGSIGYKFTRNLGVNVGVLSNAFVNANSNGGGYDTTISLASVQGGFAFHF